MENWKDISGYEGIYQVSDLGRVKNCQNEYFFDLAPHQNGYVYVGLTKAGIINHFRVHRLVAIVFIPNPNNKPIVNHLNGDKSDNRKCNLEWATNSENDLHAYALNLRKSPKVWTGKFGKDHNRSKCISQLSIEGVLIDTFGSAHEAERLTGIANQNIIKCCKQKRKSAGGYKWQYRN